MLLAALKSWEAKFNSQVTEVSSDHVDDAVMLSHDLLSHDLLSHDLQLRAQQDEERKKLQVARERMRGALGIGAKIQAPAHLDPSATTGLTDKQGYLGKRPENPLRLARNRWPKKYCSVAMQGFSLGQSHVSPPGPSLLLVTVNMCASLPAEPCAPREDPCHPLPVQGV